MMNMQQHRRERHAQQAHGLARRRHDADESDRLHAEAYFDDEWDDDDPYSNRDTTCRYCSGTGGDPWNDGITPCEHCDGEGYEWWQ
jgi:DnaJ-class molecular chaperone